MKNSLEKLEIAFTVALNLEEGTVHETLVYREIETWDSVAHMTLIAALEETFDIMIETDDVIEMSSFLKAKEILGNYGIIF